nr:TMV resistance protein N-like [Tanacetum cinerariifolium]
MSASGILSLPEVDGSDKGNGEVGSRVNKGNGIRNGGNGYDVDILAATRYPNGGGVAIVSPSSKGFVSLEAKTELLRAGAGTVKARCSSYSFSLSEESSLSSSSASSSNTSSPPSSASSSPLLAPQYRDVSTADKLTEKIQRYLEENNINLLNQEARAVHPVLTWGESGLAVANGLLNLLKIMECQKISDHTAYHVFYDVEPTEVRKKSGQVGEAFKRQEKEEVARKWREVLKEATVLTGWELKNTLDG